MFSSQIGSPNSKGFLHRPAVHTPLTFRRRRGPLFPSTPSPTHTPIGIFDNRTTPRISPPARNLFFPRGSTTPAPATPSGTSTHHVFSDYTNILRWDSDGQLHTIEFFVSKYGGSKRSPPAEWIKAPENLRVDPADGNSYDILSFITEYGGSQQFPPREWLCSSAAPAHLSNPSLPLHGNVLQLPWGDDVKTPASLFRTAPPVLKYPTGSLDENVNAHFVRSALGYL